MTPTLRIRTRLGVAAVIGVLVVSQGSSSAQATTGRPFTSEECAPASGGGTATPSWHLKRLGIDNLKNIRDPQGRPLNGQGITVAVIDTGVSDLNSSYLKPAEVITLNYLPDDPEREPFDCNHGTGVTSLIVGQDASNTTVPTIGVAPAARVYAMRVLKGSAIDQNTTGRDQENPALIYQAVRDAIELKVDVINISITTTTHRPEFQQAIKQAIDAGIVVVAAAGNVIEDAPNRGPLYPASYPGVIAVANSAETDQPSNTYSHAQEPITIAAPGTGVTVLAPSSSQGQIYAQENGTSFSAPIVSGVIALMLQREPGLTPAQIRQRLIETADPPSGAVPDAKLGYGILNPLKALAGAPVVKSNPPQPSPPPVVAPPPTQVVNDPVATRIALGAGAGAAALALLGLVTRLVIPAASKRQSRISGK